jgi:hypothetical protein
MKFPSLAPALVLGLTLTGCLKQSQDPQPSQDPCVGALAPRSSMSTGNSWIFDPDPMVASNNPILSPASVKLDSYRSPASLDRLTGRGVLEGQFVDVRNGLLCREGYLAQDSKNQFLYPHSDPRFQEAMSYVWGDRYRAMLAGAGALEPNATAPMRIVAHCMRDDNAYYVRHEDQAGTIAQKVCLGDSVATPGASYADDATVVVHELQHATTVNSYSLTQELNTFFYDESGALNEAISDFSALAFLEPSLPASFDPRLFSRWALGTFMPGQSSERGAHWCPAYDSDHGRGCRNSRLDTTSWSGFSGSANTVSYVYPDGLGWPFADNFRPAGSVRQAFTDYPSQEEIHNAGILMVGALYDAFVALRSNHGGDSDFAHGMMAVAIKQALLRSPKPTLANLSPVTLRGFSSDLVAAAGVMGWSSPDVASLTSALTARGLIGGPELASGWAMPGPGISPNPGVLLVDDPNRLRGWLLYWLGSDPNVVQQGISTGLNQRLDEGETAAIWFDIGNRSELTAGGLLLTVTSQDPGVTFLDGNYNVGAISAQQAQIRYGKVNGSGVVRALSPEVPTGTSYFQTNPAFASSPFTGLWIRAAKSGSLKGKTVHFQVRIEISNGATETLDFPLAIP